MLLCSSVKTAWKKKDANHAVTTEAATYIRSSKYSFEKGNLDFNNAGFSGNAHGMTKQALSCVVVPGIKF